MEERFKFSSASQSALFLFWGCSSTNYSWLVGVGIGTFSGLQTFVLQDLHTFPLLHGGGVGEFCWLSFEMSYMGFLHKKLMHTLMARVTFSEPLLPSHAQAWVFKLGLAISTIAWDEDYFKTFTFKFNIFFVWNSSREFSGLAHGRQKLPTKLTLVIVVFPKFISSHVARVTCCDTILKESGSSRRGPIWDQDCTEGETLLEGQDKAWSQV